jgi:hypothetical protein
MCFDFSIYTSALIKCGSIAHQCVSDWLLPFLFSTADMIALEQVKGMQCIMQPGDALVIPQYWCETHSNFAYAVIRLKYFACLSRLWW